MSTITYMCLSVRGFIRNSKFPRDYRGVFKHNDGRPMSPNEARDTLLDEIAKGHHVIPLSPHCANPCTRPNCAGFNYGEGGGCPGHPE